jgi:hypothetical protein
MLTGCAWQSSGAKKAFVVPKEDANLSEEDEMLRYGPRLVIIGGGDSNVDDSGTYKVVREEDIVIKVRCRESVEKMVCAHCLVRNHQLCCQQACRWMMCGSSRAKLTPRCAARRATRSVPQVLTLRFSLCVRRRTARTACGSLTFRSRGDADPMDTITCLASARPTH